MAERWRVSLAILFVPINRRLARAFICSLHRFADELIVAAQLQEPFKSRVAPQKSCYFAQNLFHLRQALGMAVAKRQSANRVGDNHGGLVENRFLSRCAEVRKLPNKISGRRPLFLM
jgi:hypothetical protein